jgi:hypothetical protein
MPIYLKATFAVNFIFFTLNLGLSKKFEKDEGIMYLSKICQNPQNFNYYLEVKNNAKLEKNYFIVRSLKD